MKVVVIWSRRINPERKAFPALTACGLWVFNKTYRLSIYDNLENIVNVMNIENPILESINIDIDINKDNLKNSATENLENIYKENIEKLISIMTFLKY